MVPLRPLGNAAQAPASSAGPGDSAAAEPAESTAAADVFLEAMDRSWMGRAPSSAARRARFETGTRPVAAAELSALFGKYGGGLTTLLMDPAYRFFDVPGIDGVVGYKSRKSHALVPGGPVTDPASTTKILGAFRDFVRGHGKQLVIYGAGQEVARWARENRCGVIEFGVEHALDPRNYVPADADLAAGGGAGAQANKGVRRMVRQAKRTGVELETYRPGDPRPQALDVAMQTVADAWQAAKSGTAHLDKVALFDFPEVNHHLVARHKGEVVGVLLYQLVGGGKTCFVEQLIHKPGGPNGTSELLVDGLLKRVQQGEGGAEPCAAVVFGFDAAAHLGEMSGFGWLSQKVARAAYDGIASRFGLGSGGKLEFRRKFGPVEERKAYLIIDPPHIGPQTALELREAFQVA